MEGYLRVLQASIDPKIVPNIIAAIGITNSVITFVLTSILQRRSMVRWRKLTWITFTFLWSSIVFCLVDLLIPSYGPSANNLGTKCGILLWAVGLGCLIFLVYKIFSVSLSPKRRRLSFGRSKITPFEVGAIEKFGTPFLDDMARRILGAGGKIFFPIVLITDRTGIGLKISQRFLTQGIRENEGCIYLSFTRPWNIIADQITSHLPKGFPLENRVIILDCYQLLYLPDERPGMGASGPPGIDVRFCDPRDPVEVKIEITKALRAIQRLGIKKVRLLYDSLSDFISVADEELVVSFLRRSIVWEELYGVKSIYLVWPDILRSPITDDYLAWFGNTVLRIGNENDHHTALLEGVGSKPVAMTIDGKLEGIGMGNFSIDEERAKQIGDLITRLRYRPDECAGITPFVGDPYHEAHFIFFLTAIDHNTHGEERYEMIVDGSLVHGSDLLYELARRFARMERDFFTPQRLKNVSPDELVRVFRAGLVVPVRIHERAKLLNDAADTLLEKYDGDIRNLFAGADGYLRPSKGPGILSLLREFKAYEDPLEKKSFLLVKLLRRRKLVAIRDTENINVPVDHVLFTLALRSGLVRMDQSAKEAIMGGVCLDTSLVEALRAVTLMAFREVAAISKVAADEFDDLLWAYGREILKEAVPFPEEKAAAISIDHLNERIGDKNALAAFIRTMAGIDSESLKELSRIPIPCFSPTWYF